jgi:dTDP-4-amino-4,6-dideoxygalactose transaminase
MNPHVVTKAFEGEICEYTGAPYCVTVDNQSNAIFLALMYDNIKGKDILIPCFTYPSIPCEIIHAGGNVKFYKPTGSVDGYLKGAYPLLGSKVWDSALRFTGDMYIPDTYMCCSFTGAYKYLNLGKGGCILTDNRDAYEWFKKARFSGREECSYHDQKSFGLGWNFYMNPMIASLGLLNMAKFYNINGSKKQMPDIELPYPDLSKQSIYTQHE